MREITLTKGLVALVDDEDFDRVNAFRWHVLHSKRTNYAIRTECLPRRVRRHVSMHRFIIGAGGGVEVDHIDMDGLHNCRSNLRECSRSENSRNTSMRPCKTGYRGVSFAKSGLRFRAIIVVETRTIHLGYFDTAREAAIARDEAALRFHGDFARLNFPAMASAA